MKAIHINSLEKYGGKEKAYSDENMKRRMKFAEDAIQMLKATCPEAIVDGLVRVDIFETSDGRLVVNEFESFEALFQNGTEDDFLIESFLVKYWFHKIKMFIFDVEEQRDE
jgi:hypothetical protein